MTQSAADRAEQSPTDRARAALLRAHLDPADYRTLAREIAKEICEAEYFIFKGVAEIAHSMRGGRLGIRVRR